MSGLTNLIGFLGIVSRISNDGSLRPFELASLRLSNMIEVLSNWNIYMNNTAYLTQRGATFLIDDSNEI